MREVKLPTRPRRLGQWAATVLFVIASMLAAAWLWHHQGEQVEVLVVDAAVPAGHVLARNDLTSTSVSGVGGAVPVADVDRVVGSTAAVGLVPGQILIESVLTSEPVPSAGKRVVGLELDATRAPLGLASGDMVTVLVAPPAADPSDSATLDKPRLLAKTATVFRVGTVDGGGTRLSLVVTNAEAVRVAAYGAAGRVALVQAPIGTDN